MRVIENDLHKHADGSDDAENGYKTHNRGNDHLTTDAEKSAEDDGSRTGQESCGFSGPYRH
jgi:hypothetical protein